MSDWMQLYKDRVCSAAEAVRWVQSEDRVFLTGNCSVPNLLLEALVERAQELHDVEIIQVLTLGANAYVKPEMRAHIRVNTMFVSDNVRDAVNDGRADYTPIFLSEIPALFRHEMPLDVALIHVAPPDEHGFCSFGVEVGLTKTAAEVAGTVLLLQKSIHGCRVRLVTASSTSVS
jgi:4-hydroxybutyrate CoA-transferase